MLLVVAVVAAGVTGYLAHSKSYYESTGSLLIRFGSAAGPDLSQNGKPSQADDEHGLISGYIQILLSHDLLLPLVQEIGPDVLYPGTIEKTGSVLTACEVAVGRLEAKDLVATPDPNSTVLRIEVYNEDPKVATAFLNRLLTAFTVRQSQVYDNPQVQFLSDQVKHSADALAVQQQQLGDYKTEQGITSVEGELGALLQEKSDAKSAALQAINDAQNTLDELRTKEAELLATYLPDSYPVRRERESIMIAQRQLKQRQDDLRAATYLDENATTPPGVGPSGMPPADGGGPFTQHIIDLNRRIQELEAKRSRYNNLLRGVEMAETDYKNYQTHLEQARVDQQMREQNITRVSILDQPSRPMSPSRPKRKLIEMLGALAALLLSIGTAIAFETLDERFSNPEQLASALRLPVMASFGKARRR